MSTQPGVNLYEGLAEFHDLFMVDAWQRLRPAVRTTFAGLGPEATIVEVGAGTGMGTRVIAAETESAITAIEPAITMRTALICQVANDPELSRRVTVLAGSAPTAIEQLTGRLDGFVCAHMLGHLDADDRRRTFAALAEQMSVDAVGLVTVQREPDPDQVVAAPVEQRTIGRYVYRLRYRPESESESFSAIYEVLENDVLIRSEQYSSHWTPLTAAELAAELDAVGLTIEPIGPHAGVIRLQH